MPHPNQSSPDAARKPHLSPSSIDMFLRCGEQFRRRDILKESIPPGIAMLKGRAVHKAAEVNNRQKIESGVDLPESDLVDAATTEFDTAIKADGLGLSVEENAIGATKVVGQAKDASVSLTRVYRRLVAPAISPVLVEEFVRVELATASHDLLGKLDVVDAQGRVRDLKTSGRKKSQADVDESDQLTYYDMAVEKLTGKPSAGVVMDVLVETKVPDVQMLTSFRTARDREVYLSKLNAVLGGIKAGIFLPATPGHWVCTQKFCGYWNTCPFVNSERKAAAALA